MPVPAFEYPLRLVYMTDVPLSLNVLNGGKDTYFPSDRLSGQMKAKGKTHMCFPQRPLIQPGVSLLAVPAIPHLTLAMPAVIALLAPLLVHHRVAATLRAQMRRWIGHWI